jgi:hypothetical protein
MVDRVRQMGSYREGRLCCAHLGAVQHRANWLRRKSATQRPSLYPASGRQAGVAVFTGLGFSVPHEVDGVRWPSLTRSGIGLQKCRGVTGAGTTSMSASSCRVGALGIFDMS